MGTSNQSNKQTLAQDVVQTGSPMSKKGRKVLSIDKLPFSPRVKPPQINKVFVVGAPLGVILIRTERQNGKDDAFTNNAQKILEDEASATRRPKVEVQSPPAFKTSPGGSPPQEDVQLGRRRHQDFYRNTDEEFRGVFEQLNLTPTILNVVT